MSDCLFCRLIAGEIPANLLWDDSTVVAFRDIDPQAPTHILVVPRRHIGSTEELSTDDTQLIGQLLLVATALAEAEGLKGPDAGYRLVINTGPRGGQSVGHLHVHLLGGRQMNWPPG
ncbi:MAG: histidine triad nucleotide-binding protein [bacterium]